MHRAIQLLRSELAGSAALDTALARAVLQAVAAGERPESLRLWRPGDAVAFSVADRARTGFESAVARATERGFEAFLRLAGGHAAVYTRETLAFAWAIPARDPRAGIRERFAELAEWVAAALRCLGVEARVGEVAGEYCPGAHSVNARGRIKLMGVGQRVIQGAAHLGGVIVVRQSARARAVLEPVYGALDLDFDPATVGSVEDEVAGASRAVVTEALLRELRERHAVSEAALDPELLERARRLEGRHALSATPRGVSGGPRAGFG